MATTPTQRTLRALRDRGLVCAIVEKWNQYAGPFGIRQDLFGIIDVLALDPQRGVIGVQSTGQDFAGHMEKLKTERFEECRNWLSTPGTSLELWGWRKVRKVRGGTGLFWQPRVHVFSLDEFPVGGLVVSEEFSKTTKGEPGGHADGDGDPEPETSYRPDRHSQAEGWEDVDEEGGQGHGL